MRASREHNHFIRALELTALMVLALGLGACSFARRFDVQISSLAHPTNDAPVGYVLVPADPAITSDDLQFLEFARSVEVGLERRGFVRLDAAEPNAMVIAVRYGIGEPETKTIQYPRSAFASGSLYGDYPGYGRHSHRRHRHGAHCGHAYSLGFRDPLYSALPTTVTYTTYNRFLSLDARTIEVGRDLRSGPPLWSTRVESRGRVDDLRRVLPILVSAAVDYLATDTGQRIETRIAEDDERVLSLRRALALPRAAEESEGDGAVHLETAEPG